MATNVAVMETAVHFFAIEREKTLQSSLCIKHARMRVFGRIHIFSCKETIKFCPYTEYILEYIYILEYFTQRLAGEHL